jgi:hypothetical protein
MPLPSDLKVWLDDAWDEANGKDTGQKKGHSRGMYGDLELKAIINLDARAKGEELIIVRIRRAVI